MASIEEHERWALSYLLVTHDENHIKEKRSELRSNLHDHILEHGEEDEDGNLIVYFDEPKTVDGETWFKGLMLQRRVSEYVDEDKVWELVRKHDLGDMCLKTVEVLDLDMFYAANQQGLISDEELDSVLTQEKSWALVKIKAL